ncbi:MAG: endonuclease/exonuclease/phosphatase family protein [Bacteroidaceae bacterium]|nr:endonuclease/exonuclease/phosphatase family protein [Bacteroidaceae bacterium]
MKKLKLILCLLIACLPLCAQSDGITLRMMTYNIRHGAGMDDVVDLERQAKVIQSSQPDVVGLQEVDYIVPRSGRVDETAYFADYLGMYGTFGPAIPLSGGKYGVAILSKEKPLSVSNTPLPGKEKRTLLVCEFQNYVFACTHLDLEEPNRLASLDIIIAEASRWSKPFFICGDWNDKPNSTLITTMKKDDMFVFLNRLTNSSSSYTFPAQNPNRVIDYIASYGNVVRSINLRKVIANSVSSDHRPVLVSVVIDDMTGIVSPVGESEEESACYDLYGRKCPMNNGRCSMPRGIYIVNGKKKVVR